jgi:hypothetical protein
MVWIQYPRIPAKHCHQKRNCRLVDFGYILHRDHDIADDEDTGLVARNSLSYSGIL